MSHDTCRRCHENGIGCCTDEIFCTLHDALRLSTHTGMPVDEIVEWRELSKPFLELRHAENFKSAWIDNHVLMIRQFEKKIEEEEW